jgi:hypothetical protein
MPKNKRTIDPRVPGGVYRNGYWMQNYTVLAMWDTVEGRIRWYHVKWEDGRETTHCTSWSRSDRVISGFLGRDNIVYHLCDLPLHTHHIPMSYETCYDMPDDVKTWEQKFA